MSVWGNRETLFNRGRTDFSQEVTLVYGEVKGWANKTDNHCGFRLFRGFFSWTWSTQLSKQPTKRSLKFALKVDKVSQASCQWRYVTVFPLLTSFFLFSWGIYLKKKKAIRKQSERAVLQPGQWWSLSKSCLNVAGDVCLLVKPPRHFLCNRKYDVNNLYCKKTLAGGYRRDNTTDSHRWPNFLVSDNTIWLVC